MYYSYEVTPLRERFALGSTEKEYPVLVKVEIHKCNQETEEVMYKTDFGTPSFNFGPILSELVFNNVDVPGKVGDELIEMIEAAVKEEIEIMNKTLDPLTQWECDSCNQIIQDENDGLLEFVVSSDYKGKVASDFRIVHKTENCVLPEDMITNNITAIAIGLSKVDRIGRLMKATDKYAIGDIHSFSEIIKRLEVPYYEEARFYINEDVEDVEYDRNTLRKIVIKHSVEKV